MSLIFDALMATSMKMAVLWNVAQYDLVDIDKCFRGAYFLHL
jgi:hypothetical protein